ncbi:MAG: trypsin-like peptidase domain-containing protein [Acidobacteriota bacterium]|nr:trypsin-like peptidase domain-containing protein [Acidobacteriota bacterium]
MRFRTLLLTVAFLFGFWFVTSRGDLSSRSSIISRLLHPLVQGIGNTGRLWSQPETAQTASLSADEQNNIDIYKAARTATVNITSIVYQENFFMQVFPSKGTGSGFLINENGQILTNNHVVNGSQNVSVTLSDHKQYKARILGNDPRNDLALIQINANRKLPFVHLGDSSALQVGQKVLAIGNPFGLEGTLTTGIVSSLGRSLAAENDHPLEDLIQTDAAINPGNSGGPLLDSHGNVIGINTAIYGSQSMADGQAGNIGIGFAMPINRAKVILDEFRSTGRITNPVLGVQSIFVQGELAEALSLPTEGGLLVQRVDRDSPALQAGVRGPTKRVVIGNYAVGIGGDLITAIDGKPIETQDAVQRAMTRKRVGDSMELTILRNGRTQKINVHLGESGAVL